MKQWSIPPYKIRALACCDTPWSGPFSFLWSSLGFGALVDISRPCQFMARSRDTAQTAQVLVSARVGATRWATNNKIVTPIGRCHCKGKYDSGCSNESLQCFHEQISELLFAILFEFMQYYEFNFMTCAARSMI
jgi:hypothetical protein